jgi:hypothetical protein
MPMVAIRTPTTPHEMGSWTFRCARVHEWGGGLRVPGTGARVVEQLCFDKDAAASYLPNARRVVWVIEAYLGHACQQICE